MWATNLDKDGSVGDLRNIVKVCHSRWHIENRCFKENADIWNLDHIYRHSENGIIVFMLFLFMAAGTLIFLPVEISKTEKLRPS